MEDFDFASPNSLDEALSILASKGDRARMIAGGTDILVQMRAGRRAADVVESRGKALGGGALRVRYSRNLSSWMGAHMVYLLYSNRGMAIGVGLCLG